MTREEINSTPIRKFTGPITLISTPEAARTAASWLKTCNDGVLGFDTETRPAYKKGQYYPPSLLQLADGHQAFIFQLQRCGMPEELLAVLADQEIVKAGVAIAYDVQELQKIAMFPPGGFHDLGDTARQKGIKNHGLRGLAAVLLGFRIGKGAQKSNWAAADLTTAQLTYAATDAWVGRKLFFALNDIPL